MDIRYRQACPQDEEQLFDLAAALATSYALNQADFAAIYAKLLDDPNVDIAVAETESQMIGYAVAYHHAAFYANGVVSWVEELFVLERYRGLKIGKRLMDNIEEKARRRGSKLVALATRRASAFYKAIGYEESAAYFKKPL